MCLLRPALCWHYPARSRFGPQKSLPGLLKFTQRCPPDVKAQALMGQGVPGVAGRFLFVI